MERFLTWAVNFTPAINSVKMKRPNFIKKRSVAAVAESTDQNNVQQPEETQEKFPISRVTRASTATLDEVFDYFSNAPEDHIIRKWEENGFPVYFLMPKNLVSK